TWTELARPVVHAGIDVVANGSDLPYPSPESGAEEYGNIGEAIIKRIDANNFNDKTHVTT
ncbi:hypothetical protein AAVH_25697, partial [Aphelenchoides avenae]